MQANLFVCKQHAGQPKQAGTKACQSSQAGPSLCGKALGRIRAGLRYECKALVVHTSHQILQGQARAIMHTFGLPVVPEVNTSVASVLACTGAMRKAAAPALPFSSTSSKVSTGQPSVDMALLEGLPHSSNTNFTAWLACSNRRG